MRRRIIGIVLAVLLAFVGTLALVRYVKSAKDDAIRPEEQVKVLIVQNDVRQGAPVSEVLDNVKVVEVPRRLVAPGALTDLVSLDSSLVTAVDFLEGDQILASRFIDPRTLVNVEVPKGLQEITFAFTPERAIGADLQAGDSVGVLFSFEPFDLNTSGTPSQPTETTVAGDPTQTTVAPTRTPNTTHFVLHKILVTSVKFSKQDSVRASEIQSSNEDQSTDTTVPAVVDEAPADQLLVTMAVSAAEAEQLVFAAEFGSIWLTLEGPDASEEGTRILTLAQVMVPVPR